MVLLFKWNSPIINPSFINSPFNSNCNPSINIGAISNLISGNINTSAFYIASGNSLGYFCLNMFIQFLTTCLIECNDILSLVLITVNYIEFLLTDPGTNGHTVAFLPDNGWYLPKKFLT